MLRPAAGGIGELFATCTWAIPDRIGLTETQATMGPQVIEATVFGLSGAWLTSPNGGCLAGGRQSRFMR